MVKFFQVALCVTMALVGVNADDNFKYGMEMTSRAYDAVCWYENLKIFPKTNTDGFMKCVGQAKQVMDQVDVNGDQGVFGQFLNDLNTIGKLPSDYQSACGKYTTDISAAATQDESDVLNEDAGDDYPYKALAHCLITTLRKRHTNKATDAVKNEKTKTLKNWKQTLLDRENEFRARHGAPPLKLNKELTTAAQEWAQTNANECNMYHSTSPKYRGKDAGESLSASGGDENRENAAYVAADGWYEEVKDYPYPGGYQGDGNDELFSAIGHFTQSVWKESKYVGYGYAFNKDCGGEKQYIAARYYPAGNMPGAFEKNVNPVLK